MIGLDLGTTNCKAVLLDVDGHVKAKVADSYKLQIPHPGWAEQDVRHVWEAAKKVLRSVTESAPVTPQGICLSGAMHSLFPIADDAGTPISNAMTWADARATAVYKNLLADASAAGAGLLGLRALGLIGAEQIAATVEPDPIYSPDPERHTFYRQHHREFNVLRQGMSAQGETLEKLKESSL